MGRCSSCTVVVWRGRKNADALGPFLLQTAQVPEVVQMAAIISYSYMDQCLLHVVCVCGWVGVWTEGTNLVAAHVGFRIIVAVVRSTACGVVLVRHRCMLALCPEF